MGDIHEMRSFKDQNGNAWDIDVNVGVLMRIKDEMGVNLLDNPENDLPESHCELVGILWCCVAEQLKKKGMTPEQFGAALGGEHLHAGIDAFMEELMDFFIHLVPAKGGVMKTIWERAKQAQEETAQLITKAAGSVSFDLQESRG